MAALELVNGKACCPETQDLNSLLGCAVWTLSYAMNCFVHLVYKLIGFSEVLAQERSSHWSHCTTSDNEKFNGMELFLIVNFVFHPENGCLCCGAAKL